MVDTNHITTHDGFVVDPRALTLVATMDPFGSGPVEISQQVTVHNHIDISYDAVVIVRSNNEVYKTLSTWSGYHTVGTGLDGAVDSINDVFQSVTGGLGKISPTLDFIVRGVIKVTPCVMIDPLLYPSFDYSPRQVLVRSLDGERTESGPDLHANTYFYDIWRNGLITPAAKAFYHDMRTYQKNDCTDGYPRKGNGFPKTTMPLIDPDVYFALLDPEGVDNDPPIA